MARRRSPLDASLRPQLLELCARIRAATRREQRAALRRGSFARLARPHGQGVGDIAYGIDVPCERAIDAWLRDHARRAPISLLTEDTGWRHFGPGPRGRAVELDGFDHGGPRIAIDPIDGTRHLMSDLRSAWTVVSIAPPGPGEPRLSELRAGIVAELPDSRGAAWRLLEAWDGRASYERRSLAPERLLERRALRVDREARVDHGYFAFFRYTPAMRPALAALEADFFARLERRERAQLRHVYDDQYISNAGQLALLALGTYRLIVDARALLTRELGLPSIPSKPYDMAGAIVVARAAGAVVLGADGAALDFPIDARTPVHFAGFANEPTRARLLPHLRAALRSRLRAEPRSR